jgi:hypothetical protein
MISYLINSEKYVQKQYKIQQQQQQELYKLKGIHVPIDNFNNNDTTTTTTTNEHDNNNNNHKLDYQKPINSINVKNGSIVGQVY